MKEKLELLEKGLNKANQHGSFTLAEASLMAQTLGDVTNEFERLDKLVAVLRSEMHSKECVPEAKNGVLKEKVNSKTNEK